MLARKFPVSGACQSAAGQFRPHARRLRHVWARFWRTSRCILIICADTVHSSTPRTKSVRQPVLGWHSAPCPAKAEALQRNLGMTWGPDVLGSLEGVDQGGVQEWQSGARVVWKLAPRWALMARSRANLGAPSAEFYNRTPSLRGPDRPHRFVRVARRRAVADGRKTA